MSNDSEQSRRMTLDADNAEMLTAWQLVKETSQSVFLTGKAGTGKSTLLRYITLNTAKKHVVLAPTGIAAINVGGQTLHSFFRLPFKPTMPDDPDFAARILRKRMRYGKELIKLLKQLELIIIDEISMVRADTIDFIDKLLRVYCGDMRRPFAGKQLLMVGDVFQLEPVVTADTRDIIARTYGTPYFFNAQVFREMALVPVELRKVYRQTDAGFVGLLDRVRDGHPTPADLHTINSRLTTRDAVYDRPAESGELPVTIATRRDLVDSINSERLAALRSPAVTFRGSIEGDFPESSLPTDLELTLKTGAQVMFVRNDPERRWVNGSIGLVEDMPDDGHIAVRTSDGLLHSVEQERWSNIRYEYDEKTHKINEVELGSFTQYPLKLAWALTVHKSQGMTFDNVVLDFGRGAFAGGQSYVALSRCRSLDGIRLLSTLAERDIYVHPAVVQFSRTFNSTEIISEAIASARADAALATASKAFATGDYATAVDNFAIGAEARPALLRSPGVRRLVARRLGIIGRLQAEADELRARLAEAEARFRSLADEYVALGQQCIDDAADCSAAIANYDKALRISPGHGPALLGKGRALALCGDYDGAERCLRQAADAAPDDWQALAALTDIYMASHAGAEALDCLLQALEAAPAEVQLHDSLATLYDSLDMPDDAEIHRDAAARLRRKKRKK
ncbi:MAG: AAA family ATPase [Muribaculaceae bacterium]|nr:AAA family ATPase [Muribaculaceae bacterium]